MVSNLCPQVLPLPQPPKRLTVQAYISIKMMLFLNSVPWSQPMFYIPFQNLASAYTMVCLFLLNFYNKSSIFIASYGLLLQICQRNHSKT